MTFAKAHVPSSKGGHMARCTSEWALGEICFHWGCREMLCPAVVIAQTAAGQPGLGPSSAASSW